MQLEMSHVAEEDFLGLVLHHVCAATVGTRSSARYCDPCVVSLHPSCPGEAEHSHTRTQNNVSHSCKYIQGHLHISQSTHFSSLC